MQGGLTPTQFQESEGVEDWRVLSEGACTFFPTASFAASARLVDGISRLPGIDDGHIAVDVRHDGVTVRLLTITDDWFGMSRRDVELARHVSGVARDQGIAADPSAVQTILVGIYVPPEQAEARVAAALAAGGRMVRDQFAPAWWTLADAAGNEADIATTTGRE